jgi:hypothetical protein
MLTARTADAWFGPGGRLTSTLLAGQTIDAGRVELYNTKGSFNVEATTRDGWRIKEIQIFVGDSTVQIPMTKDGNPIPGKFPFKAAYTAPVPSHVQVIDFEKLGFAWGSPYETKRLQNVAVHADLVQLDTAGQVIAEEGAWAFNEAYYEPFPGDQWGWYVAYTMAKPMKGHLWDSPVEGVTYVSGVGAGVTDASGGFEYFPEEKVAFFVGNLSLGTVVADHRVTPLDFFEGVDLNENGSHMNADGEDQSTLDSNPAINVARLLQSLDEDGDPKGGIRITDTAVGCLNAAAADLGLNPVNFANGDAVEALINKTVGNCTHLVAVSAEDAKAHLDDQLSGVMFRKNGSKTPDMGTTKSKLEVVPVLVPARKANGDSAAPLVYYDEDGNELYTRDQAKPLVIVYADQNPDSPTLASDVFGAVSRDDGKTWKRKNLSRAADRSSFTLANGEPFYGDVKKPNLTVKDNYILVAWQSRYSRDENDPNYTDDIYGVGGPQRSHDYTEDGFPEVGELPFYALWICRGVIDPATGDISWRKPERLTSARRDVYQISINGANNVGFGIVWQEDPKGVRPGEAAGPGHGWSGATTNHKTDVWYSFIKWSDFEDIDQSFEPKGDPEHEYTDADWTTNRPMPLVPFSLPMRLSDNDVCNTDNMKIELNPETGLPPTDADGNFVFTPTFDDTDPDWDGKHAGTHSYCYQIDANNNGTPDLCADFHTFVNNQGATKHVCVTEDGRLLDGDTGASRPNISFMPYTKTLSDGSKVSSAWVAFAYEETKGVGAGHPEWDDDDTTTHFSEKDKADVGKNVIYHSFDFASPERVSGGHIANLPATDENGTPLYLVDGDGILDEGVEVDELGRILDWQGLPQLAYENARRPRMLVQPAGQAGATGTVMVLLYKQGEDGKGRPSDIFMRRVVKSTSGNPYAFKNFVAGAQNISSVRPTQYWQNPNQDDQAKGEGTKVVKFEQTEANLADLSSTNPYEDARAHRGILRGDDLFIAYTHTPNWAASRNAHDKYDVYVRRSFTGGKDWKNGTGEVCHTRLWKKYVNDDGTPLVFSEDEANRKETYEEEACFASGAFEPGRNMSLLKNNKISVIEPRLVGTPGTIAGSPYEEDKQDRNVFYVAFGTESNVPKAHGNDDEEDEEMAVPLDLYYTFTRDRGETFYKRLWEVNPDSEGPNAGTIIERWDYLARGDAEQGEAQLRMSPDGSRFYAVWNEDGPEGSDAMFRRIMNREFPRNVAAPAAE